MIITFGKMENRFLTKYFADVIIFWAKIAKLGVN